MLKRRTFRSRGSIIFGGIPNRSSIFGALGPPERLIAKLAILAGLRPGEIFGLTWGRMTATHADIRQGVYSRKVDTPKTDYSYREAGLSEGLVTDIENWRMMSVVTSDDAWVFPSERMTPLSKDNCWNRIMRPALTKVGLGWANFQVIRRTHATLMKVVGADGKLVAQPRRESNRRHATASRKPACDRELAREAIADKLVFE